MKEQSHKDEMSAALRGDFQRLRERGVAVTLAPSEPEPTPETPRSATSDADLLTESASETDSCQDAVSDAPERDAEQQSRGWFGRLLGR